MNELTNYDKLKKTINKDNTQFIIILKKTCISDVILLLKLLCKNKNFKYFELIIDNYSLNYEEYCNILKFNIIFSNNDFIKKIFDKINIKIEDLNDLLYTASIYHKNDIIITLLDKGADINKHMILNSFVGVEHINFFKYLISRGADPNTNYIKHNSLINSAVIYYNMDLLIYLIEDLKLEIPDNEYSPFIFTTSLNIIEYLVEHGANINLLNEHYRKIVISNLRSKKIKKMII